MTYRVLSSRDYQLIWMVQLFLLRKMYSAIYFNLHIMEPLFTRLDTITFGNRRNGDYEKMKNGILKCILILYTIGIANCYIGTRRDACRYYLKQNGALSASPDSCELLQLFSGLPVSPNTTEMIQSRDETLNFLLFNCYSYYEQLKDCDNEENRYIPGLYGLYFNPDLHLISFKYRNKSYLM
ncbi:hypothetical protein LEP1GSC034_3783 [Leptospira interrogans str. 2003000735]|uniref:Uncharacterized protein n=6 Tax=Leptospira interrogans TaxID=173 RepID=A0A0E2D8Z9_LEPIR|nr:hypothetical protein BRAT_11060 [Leptospira interrogans serovar Bratislava]EJP01425.1 hypothetical protein LEP1GSC007_1691 [Leptospira interrogans serovar Bulgarica str. Mallika]EKN90366.1 hypothetical protein LEP1GSC027_1515 [Leptospira interrogans str. 2002000624]EKQ36020.1 hypothetical protein LEP1GSC025_0525 [Leptospira interrogans str. 2002000621]EKQ49893.1 hypothetical protein LEP1GSC026_1543 [Leptospira interrogans str. 2002000623]EKR56573.1 hypothetical protein LEP1GSC105_4321 [Lept